MHFSVDGPGIFCGIKDQGINTRPRLGDNGFIQDQDKLNTLNTGKVISEKNCNSTPTMESNSGNSVIQEISSVRKLHPRQKL